MALQALMVSKVIQALQALMVSKVIQALQAQTALMEQTALTV
jgi:hypothetical protein